MLEIDGLLISVSKKRIKNINLRINAQGEIRVSAPFYCTDKAIIDFIRQKKEWITHHRNVQLQRLSKQPSGLEEGAIQFVWGEPCCLKLYENSPQNAIIRDEQSLRCYFKANLSMEKKQALLKAWQRQQIKALLPPLIAKWEKQIGVHIASWNIKSMTTRWGTCNPRAKRIWLSLALSEYPPECLEYVLVHEMVHLLEPSHNQRFHSLMTQFLPTWPICKKQLKGRVGMDCS